MPSRSAPALFRTLLGSSLACLLLGIPGSWLSATPPQTPASKDPAIERGHKQYLESCGFCHGPEATGARGPDLLRSALVAHDSNGDKIGEVIRSGRPDKGMPALPLNDAQITDVAAYLHNRAKEVLESSGVPGDYPYEKLLTGNVVAGRKYFEGAGGCIRCHSVTGDLAGLSRKYSSIELQARMLYPESKPAMAIVTLPAGEQVSGTVRHASEFVIILRDSKTGEFRSFDRTQVKVELHDPLATHRQLLEKITQTEMHDLFAYVASLK
jgi:cytochrome c oxidase cbb3-type subunit III